MKLGVGIHISLLASAYFKIIISSLFYLDSGKFFHMLIFLTSPARWEEGALTLAGKHSVHTEKKAKVGSWQCSGAVPF